MAKVQSIFSIVGGGTPATKNNEFWGKGTPWISSADIDATGKISFRREVTQSGVRNSTTNIVPANTILVVTRVGLGKVAQTPCAMCFSQDIQALLPNENAPRISTEFMFFQFTHIMNSLRFAGQGTTISGITKNTLANAEIYVPTWETQVRIVARIEELFSELDKAVETLQTTKQQLAVYRQAVLKEAFEGKLGNLIIPEKYNLSEFIQKPRYGTSKKCDYDSGTGYTAVIRIPNINALNGIVDHDDMKHARFEDSELDSLSLEEGDILTIRSNGSVSLVGTSALIRKCDVLCVFAGYLMRLRIRDKEKYQPKYLLHYLASYDARSYIEQVAKSTSGVNNINAQEIERMKVPFVPINEQHVVVNEIESRLSVCDSIEQTVDTALAQAEAMRQSILKQAFEGRLKD